MLVHLLVIMFVLTSALHTALAELGAVVSLLLLPVLLVLVDTVAQVLLLLLLLLPLMQCV